MRALLVAVVLAALGCRQIEPSPRPSWAAAEPGFAGTVNLSEGCVSEFDPSVDYFPRKTQFLHSALADLIRAIHPEIAVQYPEMFIRGLD